MAYLGELYALYLYPEAQRGGLGRALLRAAATALYKDRLRSMIVWVLRDNPACAFYERMGARLCGATEVTLGGAQLPKVAYGWDDLSVLVESG